MRHHAACLLVELSEGRAAGNASRSESAVRRPSRRITLQLHGRAGRHSLRVLAWRHRQRREGLQNEVAAVRAGGNEGRGKREDLSWGERGVEGLGHGDGAGSGPDEGLVPGFDGQDRAGGREDRAVRDEGRCAEVGGDADVFEDCRGRDHRGGIGEAEVVRAWLDGLHAGLGYGALQEDDVLLFCLADLEKILDLPLVETKSLELGGRNLGEALLIKGGLEPFKGKRAWY